MAYRHYETRGLILSGRNFGEANRFYRIFTPDFGLTEVMAQGVRREKSKFRYQLENILVNLVLIRGREYWRLVGVTPAGPPANSKQVAFSQRLGLVLIRLIHGEEASHQIFDDLCQVWDWLVAEESTLVVAEIFSLVRLLAALGYLAETPESTEILAADSLTLSLVSVIEKKRRTLVSLINTSLLASGL